MLIVLFLVFRIAFVDEDNECCKFANLSFAFKNADDVYVKAVLRSGEVVYVANFTDGGSGLVEVSGVELPPHTVKIIIEFVCVSYGGWYNYRTPQLKNVEIGLCCPAGTCLCSNLEWLSLH